MNLYLDHAATTKPYPQVVELMHDVANIGNPSSLHRQGRDAATQIQAARQQIADMLEVHSKGIVFCSGATEANNLAVFGNVRALGTKPKHLITSSIEHPSVLEPFRQLEREGWSVTYLPCSRSGKVELSAFAQAIRSDTVLASIMLVNNETGILQSVQSMAKIARERDVVFHCDAVQGCGKLDIRPKNLGIDLMTLSGHKIGGPRGIGVLVRSYVEADRSATRRSMSAMLHGGGQEFGLRPGTENGPAILGLALALRLTLREQASNVEKLKKLNQLLLRELKGKIPSLVEIGSLDPKDRAAHIACVAIPGISSDLLITRVDQQGLSIASGSACHSGKLGVSPVLQAMGIEPMMAQGMLRFSLAAHQSQEEMSQAAELVHQAWKSSCSGR